VHLTLPFSQLALNGWLPYAKDWRVFQVVSVTIPLATTLMAIYVSGFGGSQARPNPSFHRTLRIKPRKAGEFKRSGCRKTLSGPSNSRMTKN
jgi:hypothetical protein